MRALPCKNPARSWRPLAEKDASGSAPGLPPRALRQLVWSSQIHVCSSSCSCIVTNQHSCYTATRQSPVIQAYRPVCVCARALTLITRRIVSASVLQSCRRTDACSSAYSVICETLHTHTYLTRSATSQLWPQRLPPTVCAILTHQGLTSYLQLSNLEYFCRLQLGLHELALECSLILARLHKLSSYPLHKYSQLFRICTTTPGVHATTLV